jgi:hypothetical protein
MTLDEQKQLKKSRWIIFFVLPAFLLFLWVAYYFDGLPAIMRIAAAAIPTIAILIFTQHHFKKLKDLSLNEVIEYHDIVTKKVHFRKMRHDGRTNKTSETRYIIVANKKFHLKRKQFANCEEGKLTRIVVALISNVILSVTS